MLFQYTDYLSRWDVNVIPEMIVVGIVNTKRTRDLTPTESIINYFGKPDTSTISWMKPSGGNEFFLQFIREELMPYVEAHYKTQPFRIFAGHSFGGIAAVNCMLTHPDMFNAYIAISPSFWWDSEYVIKLADKKLQAGTVFNKMLFYSDASEGVTDSSSYHTNLLKFDTILTNKALKGFAYKYKYYPTETHMTEPLVAYYDALRFIYKDWRGFATKP
jgi:predicted alpha/beta superfamily hydrolase